MQSRAGGGSNPSPPQKIKIAGTLAMIEARQTVPQPKALPGTQAADVDAASRYSPRRIRSLALIEGDRQ
jgi:hypothetical protein